MKKKLKLFIRIIGNPKAKIPTKFNTTTMTQLSKIKDSKHPNTRNPNFTNHTLNLRKNLKNKDNSATIRE